MYILNNSNFKLAPQYILFLITFREIHSNVCQLNMVFFIVVNIHQLGMRIFIGTILFSLIQKAKDNKNVIMTAVNLTELCCQQR